MPLRDVNLYGVFTEIKEVYDYTLAMVGTQIKEVYDSMYSGVNNLVYKNAVDPFTFLEYSSKILDTDYTFMYPTYNFRIEDGSISHLYGYAFTHYALQGISSMCWNTPRDLTGLTTITIDVGYLSGSSVNCYFGISKDTTLAYYGDVVGTVFPEDVSRKVHISKTEELHQTYTLDISGVDGEYYFKFTIQSATGQTSPACYIKSITVS